MSDFLLGDQTDYPKNNKEVTGFTKHAEYFVLQDKTYQLALSRNDDANLWQPAVDLQSNTKLAILGRPALSQEQWLSSKKLKYEGGLAAQFLLNQWLTNPNKFSEYLNGYFAIIILTASAVQIFTDRLGIYPVYQANDITGLRLSSHPDLLAKWLKKEKHSLSLNPLAMAQSLATGSSFSECCFYNEIDLLKPAHHYIFTKDKNGQCLTESKVYWKKGKIQLGVSDSEWSKKIAIAIKNATQLRSQKILGKTALLLSGGADSRALLFSAKIPASIETISFCDSSNSESQTAAKLAKVANSQHQEWRRDFDHYGTTAKQSIMISGGMWSLKDAHFLGFGDKLSNRNWGALMTGCYADYLVKGLALNKQSKKIWGKNIPINKNADFKSEYYQPHFKVKPNWQKKINKVYEIWKNGDYEDLRIRPLLQEADALGRAYLMRCTPWEPVFCDNAIVNLYSTMPADVKVDYRVFAKAVQSIMPTAARSIPNNNTNARLDLSWPLLELHKLRRRIFFKIKKIWRNIIGHKRKMTTSGSWPNYQYYIDNSQVIKKLWDDTSPMSRKLISSLLIQDPWELEQKNSQKLATELKLSVLTLSLWLDMNKSNHCFKIK